VFDLTPRGIIKDLNLRNPIYRRTAAYGHFGRAAERGRFVDKELNKEVEYFTWEQANRVEELRLAVQRSPHYTSQKTRA
jgi:S-adenosylmethionine synthetase